VPWPQWQSWIDAWNRHDLEAIMTHYADDVLFTSRAAVELGGDLDGRSVARPRCASSSHADCTLIPRCTSLRSTHSTASTIMLCNMSGSDDITS
jgi:hypothetical protein